MPLIDDCRSTSLWFSAHDHAGP